MIEEEAAGAGAYALSVEAVLWGIQFVKGGQALQLFSAPLAAARSTRRSIRKRMASTCSRGRGRHPRGPGLSAEESRGWAVALGAFDWPGIGLVTLAVFFGLTMLMRVAFARRGTRRCCRC